MEISLTLNRRTFTADVEPRLLLVHLIRENARLTGTHIACETTLCGACTVLLDGRAVKSCTVLAVQANGKDVTTIEGLATHAPATGPQPPPAAGLSQAASQPLGIGPADWMLHPIQQAFWEEHGLQCGYCTPGMIMTAYQLLQENRQPSDDEIRRAIEGNLCRCTGYQNIVKAIRSAAAMMGSPGDGR